MPPRVDTKNNHEVTSTDRATFLFALLDCTDTVPKAQRTDAAKMLSLEDHWRTSSYGALARELLAGAEDGKLSIDGDWRDEIANGALDVPHRRRSLFETSNAV